MAPPTTISYLICTTPRTGSWLLCDVLSQTGLAGFPQEYLLSHTAFDTGWGVPRKETLVDYLAWVRDLATSENGVCGIKIHWSQVRHLCRTLGMDPLGVVGFLGGHLPDLRLIRLHRQDSLRQVLSYQRAISEQRWWQLANSSSAPAEHWEPDFTEVTRLRQLLTEHDRAWSELLEASPHPSLEVGYEQLVADIPGTVAEMLEFIGVDRDTAWSATQNTVPTLSRQSDDQTELQVHRYLSWCYEHDVDAPTGLEVVA